MSGGHGLGCVEEILERIQLSVKIKNRAMLSSRNIMGVTNIFIYFLFLAALGLRCCVRAFSRR